MVIECNQFWSSDFPYWGHTYSIQTACQLMYSSCLNLSASYCYLSGTGCIEWNPFFITMYYWHKHLHLQAVSFFTVVCSCLWCQYTKQHTTDDGIEDEWYIEKGLQGRGHSLIKILPWYLSGRSRERYKVSQSRHPLSQPRIELDTSKTLTYRIITTPAPMLPRTFINLLLVVIMNKVYDLYYILLGSWMAFTTENN